jgi:hypothetical protein
MSAAGQAIGRGELIMPNKTTEERNMELMQTLDDAWNAQDLESDEDRRDVLAGTGQHVVQVETALTRHPDVQHGATGTIVSAALQELAC